MQKLYKILDAPLGTNKSELKKKYHALALQHHPDKGGDEEKFKEITLAYEILSGKRKPNRHETAKYADPVQAPRPSHTGGPINPPRRDPNPGSQRTTVWPPPHMKDYWKQKSQPKPKHVWRDTPPGSSHIREEYTPPRPKPRTNYCKSCDGSGKQKRTCTACFGTGNIVGSTHPTPTAVKNCTLCSHGMQSIGECEACRGTGKHVKSS